MKIETIKTVAATVAGTLAMLVVAVVWLLYIAGAFILAALFFYGIYVLFAQSIGFGLMLIGASVVGGWLLQLAYSLLWAITLATGAGIAGVAVAFDRWKNRRE